MKFVCLRFPKYQFTFKAEIKREVNGETFREPFIIIQFQDGYYETDDELKIAYLKRHKDFGTFINVDESEVYQRK